MNKRLPNSSIVAMVVALVVASAGTLLANGEAFFLTNAGPVDLVYFAHVKDARTGRPISTVPYVTIVDGFSGSLWAFTGDSAGHFRSLDVGNAIKELSPEPIKVQQLEITVGAPGYNTVKIAQIPRKSKGLIELKVKLEPKGMPASSSGSSSASQPPTPTLGAPSPVDSIKPTIFLLGACFALAAISLVVRTAGRQTSTAR